MCSVFIQLITTWNWAHSFSRCILQSTTRQNKCDLIWGRELLKKSCRRKYFSSGWRDGRSGRDRRNIAITSTPSAQLCVEIPTFHGKLRLHMKIWNCCFFNARWSIRSWPVTNFWYRMFDQSFVFFHQFLLYDEHKCFNCNSFLIKIANGKQPTNNVVLWWPQYEPITINVIYVTFMTHVWNLLPTLLVRCYIVMCEFRPYKLHDILVSSIFVDSIFYFLFVLKVPRLGSRPCRCLSPGVASNQPHLKYGMTYLHL